MRFQYAIFDMDGLMFDTERLFVESFETAVSQALHMEFPREKLKQLLGLNKNATREKFPILFGRAHSMEECYAISDRWTQRYIQEKGIPVKPGLEKLLQYLKDTGYRIALATSSPRSRAQLYLQMTHLTDFFDIVVGGDQVQCGKPDPEIFLTAAELMGCQAPEHCIVFEDSSNGLLAAKNAGMAPVIVPDLIDPTLTHPGLCYAKVGTLADTIPILQATAHCKP